MRYARGVVTPERARLFREVADRRQQGAVVLEDVHDPHNAAAVFRTCDALGFQRVCLVFDQEAPFDPRATGKLSSSATNKWLDFDVYGSIAACLADLRRDGCEVVATVAGGGAESLFAADLAAPRLAVMLGNEQRGLSEEALTLADRRLTIPMAGMVRSLNLSVAAALVLYEVTRQRRSAGMERYRLSATERAALAQRLAERS